MEKDFRTIGKLIAFVFGTLLVSTSTMSNLTGSVTAGDLQLTFGTFLLFYGLIG